MPTGLYLVGSRSGDEANPMTANWVMQVATAPVLVAVSIEAGAAGATR
jgi:flavin reductase (DIM6/NTAB) family NADH-FMN oxidoreductase RutF